MKKNIYFFTRLILLTAISGLYTGVSEAQTSSNKQILDKIIAKVGTQIIKASDIEGQYYELKDAGESVGDSAKCDMLESALLENLFYEKAERDSMLVTADEVEAELENRIRYFVYQYGSEENLMRVTGKSLQQFKDQFRPKIKKQLQAQRTQQSIISNVKVNPREVAEFYNAIPKDSLPYFSSQVEIAQIVMSPKASEEVEEYTYKKMEGLRSEIVDDGKSFDILAGIYSEDPGSRNNGGELGFITKEQVVPEFASNAFKLDEGEVSPVFRTVYGYHIVQVMEREGEKVKARHILIVPNVTSKDIEKYEDSLNYIADQIRSKEISFPQAVGQYSTDDQSKLTGGFILDRSGNSFVNIDQLDPDAVNIIDTLEVGEISAPHLYTNASTGEKALRILFLKAKTQPHQANLDDDYNRIQAMALQEKQYKYMEQWVQRNIKEFYVEIDDDYGCENIQTFKSYLEP